MIYKEFNRLPKLLQILFYFSNFPYVCFLGVLLCACLCFAIGLFAQCVHRAHFLGYYIFLYFGLAHMLIYCYT